MYGELRRKPFVPVTAQALLEAADSILPLTTDSDSDSAPKAVDLTVKHQKQDSVSTSVHYDSSSTEGSESSTPCVEPEVSSSDHMKTPVQVMTSSLGSDTPSESLLITDKVVDNSKNTDTEIEIPNNVLGACERFTTGNLKPNSDALGINMDHSDKDPTVLPSDKAVDRDICTNMSMQINTQKNVEPVLSSITVASSLTSINVSIDNTLGINLASAITNSPAVMGLNSPANGGTTYNVSGKNNALASPITSPLMGLNSTVNGVVSGANEVESALSDTLMPAEDVINNRKVVSTQNNNTLNCVPCLNSGNVNQDHSSEVNMNSDYEMDVHGDPYLDVSLSGALEKLSVAELSVIDTLVSLHMITGHGETSIDYVHTDHNYYMMYNSNNTHVPLVAERKENFVPSDCTSSDDGLHGNPTKHNDCKIDNSVHDILLTMENPSMETTNNQSVRH